MSSIHLHATTTACLLVACTAAFSQEKPEVEAPDTAAASQSEIGVTVTRVSEDRRWTKGGTGSDGDLRVTLQFESPVPNAELLRVVVKAAEDDRGNDLVDAEHAEAEPSTMRLPALELEIDCSVRLKAASREARQLARLSGEAIFQDPAAAQPPIDLTDFHEKPGDFTESDALAAQGISLAYLDEATFDEKGSKLVREAMSRQFGGKTGAEVPDAAMGPMKALFSMGQILLVVRDPDEKVIKIEGLDGEGKPYTTPQNMLKGLWMLIATDQEKTLKTIRVHLASKEAELTRPFTVEDVPLP